MSTINGVAKRYNGDAIDYVLLFDWISGKCLGKSVPDLAGNWSFNYYLNLNIGITYVADGCEPITHGSYQFVGVWQPQALKDTNELKLWFDPSDLSTMFQDSGETTPVTASGQPVGLIKDKSGNNYHASQPVNSKRPIYQTDGVLHWLDFDGVTQSLTVINSSWFNDLQALGLVVGADISSSSQEFAAIISKLSEDYYHGFALQTSQPSSGVIRLFGLSGDFRVDNIINIPSAYDKREVISMNWEEYDFFYGAKGKGTEMASSKVGKPGAANSGANQLTIGRLNYIDDFCAKFKMYGLLLSSRALAGDRLPSIDYIAEKSGVTL